jgi:TolB protein
VTTIYGYDVASGHTDPLLGEKGVGIYPALSPDLQSLAYVSSGKLVVRDLASKTDRVLVQDELVKQYPAWSADGTNIAYQATNGNPGGFDVYAVSAAGGQARRLTQTEGDDINPIFTSDGGRMLFASEGAQPGATVLSFMNADGTGRQSDPNSPKGLIFPR